MDQQRLQTRDCLRVSIFDQHWMHQQIYAATTSGLECPSKGLVLFISGCDSHKAGKRRSRGCAYRGDFSGSDRPTTNPGTGSDRARTGPRTRKPRRKWLKKKRLDLRKVSLAVQKLLGAPKVFFWHLSQKPFQFQAPSSVQMCWLHVFFIFSAWGAAAVTAASLFLPFSLLQTQR